jgi:AcrR family transcriptional regulator
MRHDSPASRRLLSRHAGAVVSRLEHKYTEILALRDAHARGEDPPDVRARMRALASRFPGSLRELDRLPREAIVQRLAELALGELAPWMIAMDRNHRWLRVALRRPTLVPRKEGRVVPAVVDRVAAELGLTPSEVEDLIGLPSRRPRAPT